MSKGLKITFLIHAIISLVIGIGLYIIPRPLGEMVDWMPFDPTMMRMFGGALLALAVSSWLCYRAASWEQVRIVVVMEIAFTILGVLGGLYAVLADDAPPFTWVQVVIAAVFAILWIYFYTKAPKKS